MTKTFSLPALIFYDLHNLLVYFFLLKFVKKNTKVVIDMTKIDIPYPRFSHILLTPQVGPL